VKVIYFIDSLHRGGGTQKFLVDLASGLATRGFNQTVISLNDNPDPLFINQLEQYDIHVRVIGKLPILTGLGILNNILWLKKEKFDTAVTLLFVSDIIGRFMAHMAYVPNIISSLRARNINYNFIQRWLVRQTARWIDKVVLNSAKMREFAILEEGVPENKIHIIPNCVKVENYSISINRAEFRSEMGFFPQDFVIGSVGRLHKQKGQDILLKAIALLPQKDIHLLLIGEGEEIANLRHLSKKLGLEDRVHFSGYRCDVPRILKILDLYVQPSRYEGMPNSLMEAMSSACPIVASSVDGISELILDGVHGWLVTPEDIQSLAETIQRITQNPSEANRRAIAAQERVKKCFGVEVMVNAWEKVLFQTIMNY